ncbi:hypothetical protein Bca4012_082234 [Brassica carinata]|uniref:Uncharacterized protein n=1 Tax=Brassica carinata TaxID=52824 RepID=A0A8X7VC75_BRACI|nr:hypothetical protein Bca52824_028421 [Brassica carinata]
MVEPKPFWIHVALRKFKGDEPQLIVAEKELFSSDVNGSLSRLRIPNKILRKEDFLRNQEMAILEDSTNAGRKEGINAIFVDPDYKTYEVSLKQWKKNMVLSRWKPVLEGYKFKEGEKFQLWSFRCEETLYFALVAKEEDSGYLDGFSHLDFKTLYDLPSSNDDDCFCLGDFAQLNLFHSSEEYASVSALPDLGSFEDTDAVTSYYDDA